MSYLTSSDFLAQQAALAATLGSSSLQNTLQSQLSLFPQQNAQTDPYIAYLQGQQSYVTDQDANYQNALKQLTDEATSFANQPNTFLPGIQTQINKSVAGLQPGGSDGSYTDAQIAAQSSQVQTMLQNYNSTLGQQSNTFQGYLNTENANVTGYQNEIGNFVNQNNKYLQQSNQTQLSQAAANQAQAQTQAISQDQLRQQDQIKQQSALTAAVNSYTPQNQQAAVQAGSSTVSKGAADLVNQLYPQSNQTGFSLPQPGPAPQSNVIGPTPTAGGNSNQIYG